MLKLKTPPETVVQKTLAIPPDWSNLNVQQDLTSQEDVNARHGLQKRLQQRDDVNDLLQTSAEGVEESVCLQVAKQMHQREMSDRSCRQNTEGDAENRNFK